MKFKVILNHNIDWSTKEIIVEADHISNALEIAKQDNPFYTVSLIRELMIGDL